MTQHLRPQRTGVEIIMRPFNVSNKTDWQKMPAEVGRKDLELVAIRLERFDASMTLDFTETRHIDFRAWHDFISRVRSLDRGPTALRLYGLSSYCEQIIRFVSPVRDCDLFEQLFGANDFGGEGEISTDFATTKDSDSGWTSWDSQAYPWTPNAN